MAKQNGHGGKVKVGGVEIDVKGWEADHHVEMEDTTSTGSGGKHQEEPTLESLSGKFDAQWDAGAAGNPYDTPNIRPGVAITDLELYVGPTLKAFDISEGYFTKADIKSVVDGKVTWAVEFKANDWTVGDET